MTWECKGAVNMKVSWKKENVSIEGMYVQVSCEVS